MNSLPGFRLYSLARNCTKDRYTHLYFRTQTVSLLQVPHLRPIVNVNVNVNTV